MLRHSSILAIAALVLAAMASAVLSAEPPAAAAPPASAEGLVPAPEPGAPPAPSPPAVDELPYVYTNWKHFTVEDGLPDDHVLSVKADGPRVWVGTEDGLACIDKPTGKIKVWEFKDENNDGRADEPYTLPWRAITAIDVDKRTGDVWLGLFGGGLARFSAGRFDHFHQLNSGLVNDVVYGVAVQDENVWAATTAGASRPRFGRRRAFLARLTFPESTSDPESEETACRQMRLSSVIRSGETDSESLAVAGDQVMYS